MQNKDSNYFENVYLGKNNEKVSVTENKRLQKLLSVKAFNRAGDSVRADFKSFRPAKKSKSDQADLGLLLEKFN